MCSSAVKQAQGKEIEKLHQFLMRLDVDLYGSLCSQILNSEPLPSVSKAFSIVSQKEKRKVILKRDERAEGDAFSVIKIDDAGSTRLNGRSRPVCDYC